MGGAAGPFPPGLATHSTLQEFYLGDDHLLRRHDYRVDVAGGFPAPSGYVRGVAEAEGVGFRRSAGPTAPTPTAMRCVISSSVAIDLSDITLD